MIKGFRVAVVGSGPGGMYATKYLMKALGDKLGAVDVIEKLPTCYGLVRYGVAPDHPEVKSVTNDFDQVMADEKVNFFGNVSVGKDVQVSELQQIYDAVILSYGAESDRLLGLENEQDTTNVWGARDFVNWYNGHPEMEARKPPLLDCESAVIVGQGNVALDCARVLTKSVDELAKTDISTTALEMLSQSKIRRVSVLGRRGAPQAAFTIKELRELTKLEGVGCMVDPHELKLGMTDASKEEVKATRAIKRLYALIEKTSESFEQAKEQSRVIDLRFLVSPTALIQQNDGQSNRIGGLILQRNRLEGEVGVQKAIPIPDETETIDCGLLIRSIGYKSVSLPGVQFDDKKNTIKNENGRVADAAGLYASGWVKRGPSGIIGTNITDAKETVDSIVSDLESVSPKASEKTLVDLLSKTDLVDWTGYKTIDLEEQRRGGSSRDREKILSVEEMIKVAKAMN